MSLGGFDGVELVVADFREVGATLFYCNKCGGHCKVYYNCLLYTSPSPRDS